MATTEGYNGAYTGQQIDAAIGKINDSVTVPGGGTMQMGESLGGGPYTIEVTEDGESENHAANKKYVDGLVGDINAMLDAINGEVV